MRENQTTDARHPYPGSGHRLSLKHREVNGGTELEGFEVEPVRLAHAPRQSLERRAMLIPTRMALREQNAVCHFVGHRGEEPIVSVHQNFGDRDIGE